MKRPLFTMMNQVPPCKWPEQIDKVYLLVHEKKEHDRFQRLIPHFLSRGIPLEKIQVCAPTWGDELNNDTIFKVYDPFCRPGIPIFTFKARCLSKGEISLVMNFYFAARHAIDSGYKQVIFFESDSWLRADFVSCLTELLLDLQEKPWDYVSLGEGARTRPQHCDPSMFATTKAYKPHHEFVFRCTDSMMFQTSYLQKITATLFPFRECLDWELNVQTMAHKGNSWWADPPLAEQGTAVGREETTLVA